MHKLSLALVGIFALCLVTPALHAQNGCVNSPENPTAILGVIGSAGAMLFSRLKR